VFAFTGKLYDENTKLQNNLNRWYDSAIGQWLNEDPIGFAAGDENIRRYVRNRATESTDPTGLEESFWTAFRQSYDPWVWGNPPPVHTADLVLERMTMAANVAAAIAAAAAAAEAAAARAARAAVLRAAAARKAADEAAASEEYFRRMDNRWERFRDGRR